MQQKSVQTFFTARSWSFWKYHMKGTPKVTLKIEKYVYYIIAENICSVCNPIQMEVFYKYVLICGTTTQIFSLSG